MTMNPLPSATESLNALLQADDTARARTAQRRITHVPACLAGVASFRSCP